MASKSGINSEEAKERRRQDRADKRAARIRRYDAKTKAREQNGGAGVTIKFYSATGKKKSSGKKSAKR